MMYELKNDTYRRARGGKAQLLQLSCARCATPLMVYQKDGPGPLKRAYLDRVHAPASLVGLQSHAIKLVPMLSCRKCRAVIGLPYLYRKEERKAYMIELGSVLKKRFTRHD